jgi:hypothetical protein
VSGFAFDEDQVFYDFSRGSAMGGLVPRGGQHLHKAAQSVCLREQTALVAPLRRQSSACRRRLFEKSRGGPICGEAGEEMLTGNRQNRLGFPVSRYATVERNP